MLKSIFECIYKHLNNEDARYLKEKLKKMGTLNFTRIFRMLRS